MEKQKDRAWLEIDLDCIEQNYHQIKESISKDCEIMAVIKANAYGLGAVTIGKLLEKLNCPYLAVACLEEAMELRESGITTPILTLGPIDPNNVGIAIDHQIEVPAISLSQAEALSQKAELHGKSIKVHIKADAGLSRFGILLKNRIPQAVEEALAIAALPGLEAVGVLTHYTASEDPKGNEFNLAQIALFDEYTMRLEENGLHLKKHSASSAFTALYPQCHNDYVRVAALLLGLQAPMYRGTVTKHSTQFKARIMQIKELEMGTSISYGPTTYTLRHTKIAVIPVGYADGIRRTLSNHGYFLVKGKRAPIIGKITMDYIMLDITDIEGVKEGDIVTIFGEDHGAVFHAYQLADLYPGSVGELVSMIHLRVPRFYQYKGKIAACWQDLGL